jgi:hypothetical protein
MESTSKQGLLNAYGRLLRPLVKILIRNEVAYGEFAEVAKKTFVEVADKHFRDADDKLSQTGIATLTGITKKDVNRITTQQAESKQHLESNLHRVVRVLTGWHTDSNYTGPYGIPLELKFESKNEEVDFTRLVETYSNDITASEMLKELLRVEAVKETEDGWYKVLHRTYLPEGIAPDSLDHLSISVKNFVETLDHNIKEEQADKKLFERQVYTENGIRPEDLPRFRTFVRGRAQLLLEEIDNWLAQLEDPVNEDGKPFKATGLGIYHYVTEEQEDTE